MSEHYFTKQPTSEHKKRKIGLEVRGKRLFFGTDAGMFSPKSVDNGTLALIKYMQVPEKGKVLDLGCGYGVLGIIAALEAEEVILSDVNGRAVGCAKKSIRANRIRNATAVRGDMFEKAPGPFACILMNPPMAAGKEVVFGMIDGALGHLERGGSLQVVARSKKGGQSIKKRMEEVFGNVEIIGRQSGFHIYKSVRE